MDDINTVKDLKKAINGMDEKLVRDTLAYLLKVYVLDKSISAEKDSQTSHATANSIGGITSTFADIIQKLKSQYNFDELNLFTIEGKNVCISLEGKTYQLTPDNTGKNISKDEPKKSETTMKDNKPDNGFSPSGRFEKLELD